MSPNDAKGWVEVLWIIGYSGWAVAVFLIFIFVKYTEKIFLWAEKIATMLSGGSVYFSKKAISNQIRGNVLKVSKQLAKQNKEILPYDLKIEWVSEENKESFLKNKQVIVRMSQHSNPNRNLVMALAEYVKKGLMPKARKYLDQKLLAATDLAVMRKLLGIVEIDEALDYFDDQILKPALESDCDTKDLIENLSIIDNNGMLFTILLNEYVKAARKVYPNQPDPCLVAESKELLQFLYTIATKGQGEAVPLAFNREYFKIAVPLAKSDTTHINYNISEMFKNLNSGIDTIYVFGLGRKAHIAKEIAEVARSQDIRIRDIKIHNYMHKSGKSGYGKVRGVCVEVRTVNSSSDEELAESV